MELFINDIGEIDISKSSSFLEILKICNDTFLTGKYTGKSRFLGVYTKDSTYPVYMNRRFYNENTRAEYDDNYCVQRDGFSELMWVMAKDGSTRRAAPNKLNSGVMLYHCSAFCIVTNATNCDDLMSVYFNKFNIPGIDIDRTFDKDHYRYDFTLNGQKVGGGMIYKPSPDSAAIFLFINSQLDNDAIDKIENTLSKVDEQVINKKHPERGVGSAPVTADIVIEEMKKTLNLVNLKFD